ncbi:MAG: hypothetical protein NC416_06575 [Eubacterium sp.]|nr:hypothetical protein [Eubacterium sp.]
MENCIDIHSHILPCVDDGADSPETSRRMLEIAAGDGISHIILTPHNKSAHRNVPPHRIVERMGELQEFLDDRQMAVRLYAGSELYYRDGLAEELDDGTAMTLADSHYVLVEFSPDTGYDYIRNGVYLLQVHGYRPVLAHVERYRDVSSKKAGVEELVKMGCYMQVNAGSIMGNFGFAAKQFTRKLLKQRLVSFVASDAHDTGRRAPRLSECAAYVGRKFGEDYRRELFRGNPMCVIRDEYI